MSIIKMDENLMEGKVLMAVSTRAWRAVRTLNFDIWQKETLTALMRSYNPNVSEADINAVLAAKQLAEALGGMLDGTAATSVAQRFELERKTAKLSKPIIDCKSYDKINTFMRESKLRIEKMGMPFPLLKRAGLVLVNAEPIKQPDGSITSVPEIVEALANRINDTLCNGADYIPSLRATWEMEKSRARGWLGSQADYMEKFYPAEAELTNLFKVLVQFVDIRPGDGLTGELRKKELARFNERVGAAAEEVVINLRTMASGVINKMVERLTVAEEQGKKPRLYESTLLLNMQDFIETFRNRNVFSDADLKRVVDRAAEIVDGLSVGELKDSESLRMEVASKLKGVAETVDVLVEEAVRTRRFKNMDEE